MDYKTAQGTQTAQNARERMAEQTAQHAQEVQQHRAAEKRDFAFTAQKERVSEILSRPRSKEYLAAMDVIDYLSTDDEAIMERLRENMGEEFVEEIREMSDEDLFAMITESMKTEFAELETNLEDELLGVLSRCYIEGCDCHSIDKAGNIQDHYRSEQSLPEDFERGRKIFRAYRDRCQCVEVYRTCCRVIDRDGSVEEIKKQ